MSLDGRERAVTLTERGVTSWKPTVATATTRASKPSTPASAGRASCRTTSSSIAPTCAKRSASASRARTSVAWSSNTSSSASIRSGCRSRIAAGRTATGDRIGTPREIEAWAREHDLPYFDDAVHFPDFRIEYELHGRDRHEDVEVVTEHYRGGHAASVARAGFRVLRTRRRSGRSGGRAFDPRVAEDFL